MLENESWGENGEEDGEERNRSCGAVNYVILQKRRTFAVIVPLA